MCVLTEPATFDDQKGGFQQLREYYQTIKLRRSPFNKHRNIRRSVPASTSITSYKMTIRGIGYKMPESKT